MNIHEIMVKELFEEKSIKALIYLIDHGRELEFEYNNKICFISKDNSIRFVSIWIDKDEQSFDSVRELIDKAEIDGILFKNIWNEIDLGILY